MHEAVVHHIGAADILNVHPVFHRFIGGLSLYVEKLRHKMFIYYKFITILNLFKMSDLLDVHAEKSPRW